MIIDPSHINTAQNEDTAIDKRPRQITILSWFFILTSFYHFLRFFQAMRNFGLLRRLTISALPLYLAADGLFWGGTGLILAASMWKGKSWSRPAALVISILYSLVFWIDRLWIAQPEGLAQRWPVNLFLTIIGLGSIFLILNYRTSQPFFRKNPAKIP